MKVAGCAKRGDWNDWRGWCPIAAILRRMNHRDAVSLWLLVRRDCYSAAPMPPRGRLHSSLSTVEYFTFGFGTMIGVGWLVLMDDWLTHGGPAGGILRYLGAR